MAEAHAGAAAAFRRALGWQFAGVFVFQVSSAAATFVAARLTDPRGFAVWGIATIFLNAKSAVNLGLGQSLIYHNFRDSRTLQSASNIALTGTTVVAATVAGAIALAAHPVTALIVSSPSSAVVLAVRLIAIALFFMTVEDVPLSLIERTLDFRRRAVPEMAAAGAYLMVTAALLAAGFGVWSLVVGRGALSVMRFVGFWLSAAPRPKLVLAVDIGLLKQLAGYGAAVNGAAILGFAVRNLDTVAAGRVGGAVGVGAYVLAFTVAGLVPNFVSDTLVRVAFPSFASAREDRERLASLLATAMHVSATAILPTAAALAVVAPGALTTLFGPQWTPAQKPLRLLAAYIVGRALAHLTYSLLMGIGRTWMGLAIQFLALAVALPLAWVWRSAGVAGVAGAFSAGQLVAGAFGLAVARQATARFRDILLPVAPAALSAAGAAAIAGAFEFLTHGDQALAALSLFSVIVVALLITLDPVIRRQVRAGGRLRRWPRLGASV